MTCGLGHSFGSSAGGRGQHDSHIKFGENLQHRVDDGGLAGPRPAGDDHDLAFQRAFHSFSLLFSQSDGQLLLHPFNRFFRIHLPDRFGNPYQQFQADGNPGFASVKLGKINRFVVLPELFKVFVQVLNHDFFVCNAPGNRVRNNFPFNVKDFPGFLYQRFIRIIDMAVI